MRRLQQLTGTDLVDHPVNEIPGLEEAVAGLGSRGECLLAEGAVMSDAELVEYALRSPDPPPAAAVPSPREGGSSSAAEPLTVPVGQGTA
jgi:hypothetical protein